MVLVYVAFNDKEVVKHRPQFDLPKRYPQTILQLEAELKRASVQRDEVDNQLTSVTLQKDALFDEVSHVRKEMDEIRTHLDRVCEENAQLNKNRLKTAHFITAN